MILLLLRNKDLVELPDGHDVIHKSDWLVCLDSNDLPLIRFRTEKVLAYSLNSDVAQQMKDESATSDGQDSPPSKQGRTRTRSVPSPDDLPSPPTNERLTTRWTRT
jgi:hypothetical protein